MESIKKIIEKETNKVKKNPGKENKRRNQEINKAKRGESIPVQRVVEPKKAKARKRNVLKRDLQKEIKSHL